MLPLSQSRWFLVSSAFLLALLGTFLQSPSLHTSSTQISLYQPPTPDEIISRAKAWVYAGIMYSQNDYHQDYRQDCSGFVSMAWDLGKSLDTDTLPSVAQVITKNQLQKGDILLDRDGGHSNKFAHVVLFVGWANAAHTTYDAYEENGYYKYNKAREEPQMPYPYYQGNYRSAADYVPMRLDPSKIQKQGLSTASPTPVTRPGGLWISPRNGNIVGNTIHFAAWAYPTYPPDPAIQYVNFTIESQGSWMVVCTISTTSSTPIPAPTPLPISLPALGAQIFSCDANLPRLGIPPGKIQVSFDVYDSAGGFNFAPNGVHTLTYSNKPDFTPFAGNWIAHGVGIAIHSDGTADYDGRVYIWCTDDSRPPCDTTSNNQITGGLDTQITFTSINGNIASGSITGGTGDRDIQGNILPVGSPFTVTLNPSNDTLQASDGTLFCGPNTPQNDPNYLGCIN